jgi:hypothetical protein
MSKTDHNIVLAFKNFFQQYKDDIGHTMPIVLQDIDWKYLFKEQNRILHFRLYV